MSKRYLAVATLSAIIAAPVALSAERRELVNCAAQADSVKRLACFDELATKYDATPSTRSTTSSGAGKWRTTSRTDPLTDTSIHVATLEADSGRGRFGDPVTLLVRCAANKTEMWIAWESYIGGDTALVTSRVGKDPAGSRAWNVSTNNKSTFFPGSPIATLKRFVAGEPFVANVTPYGENPVTASFDTTGAEAALADIRKSCGW